jgi:fatty acid desaturase
MKPVPFLLWSLTIVFIVLKLVGVISWAWWLVFMPVLAPLAAVVSLLCLKVFLMKLEWWTANEQQREQIKLRRKLAELSDALEKLGMGR